MGKSWYEKRTVNESGVFYYFILCSILWNTKKEQLLELLENRVDNIVYMTVLLSFRDLQTVMETTVHKFSFLALPWCSSYNLESLTIFWPMVHPYHLDESSFCFRGSGRCILFNWTLHRNSCKQNNVDSDQTWHCLPMFWKWVFSLKRLNDKHRFIWKYVSSTKESTWQTG